VTLIRSARDLALLDALESRVSRPFEGRVWRIVRDGRDPLQCSAVGGRWDDRSFDVLYTSVEAGGAKAEIFYHLSKGQPVFPSKIRHRLFEIEVQTDRILELSTLTELQSLGVNTKSFGQLHFAERHQEYPRTQEVAEAAHFLGFSGLIVPSARGAYQNAVLYGDKIDPAHIDVAVDHGLVDWTDQSFLREAI
jgi:RES domain-containing protein